MKIQLVSVEHTAAGIELRERFSFTESGVRAAVRHIRAGYPVEGVVLLSTCNRTELYLSGGDADRLDPAAILREAAEEGSGRFAAGETLELPPEMFREAEGEAAVTHLMEVACGLRSRILCEDQIITQVKRAAVIAREERAIDPVLETLFRLAATAAKKAKTTVTVKAVPASAAESAVSLLERELGGLAGTAGLVVGNGEMGRLCASRLAELGSRVTVTLRTYRHGETVVPYGCRTIPYDDRADLLPEADYVVSATASPHYTLTREMLEGLAKRPRLLVDLAVPRDIDPAVEELEGLRCLNIDELGGGPVRGDAPELAAIGEIIGEYHRQFQEWLNVHECRNVIESIKRIAFHKVGGGVLPGESSEAERERVELTVHKTVDLLMYSIKEELTPELVERIEKHILTSRNGGKPLE